jgi:hypothetical protein
LTQIKPSFNIRFYAEVAQPVEQGTENPCVGGSIPPLGTTKKRIPLRNLNGAERDFFVELPAVE